MQIIVIMQENSSVLYMVPKWALLEDRLIVHLTVLWIDRVFFSDFHGSQHFPPPWQFRKKNHVGALAKCNPFITKEVTWAIWFIQDTKTFRSCETIVLDWKLLTQCASILRSRDVISFFKKKSRRRLVIVSWYIIMVQVQLRQKNETPQVWPDRVSSPYHILYISCLWDVRLCQGGKYFTLDKLYYHIIIERSMHGLSNGLMDW